MVKKKVSLDVVAQLNSAQNRLAALLTDAEKFQSGNNAAATRLRVALQDHIKAIKGLRVDILEARKNR